MMGLPRLDFYEVTSTLDVAREQVRRGAAHGTLIMAVHQTAGRGRRGAAWHDGGGGGEAAESAGANALLTFVLSPGEEVLPLRNAWRIPFIASLACVEALRALSYADAGVKWPNDLVIGGKKVGGLLVESTVDNHPRDRLSKRAYLLGIGINVGQTVFPDALEYALAPTSLRLERVLGENAPNAVEVAEAVALHLGEEWDGHLESGAALIEAWRAYQMVGQSQTGIDVATGEMLTGCYVDVRDEDGAGLITVAGREGVAAVMPSA